MTISGTAHFLAQPASRAGGTTKVYKVKNRPLSGVWLFMRFHYQQCVSSYTLFWRGKNVWKDMPPTGWLRETIGQVPGLEAFSDGSMVDANFQQNETAAFNSTFSKDQFTGTWGLQ
jgi:hypothetical protein